MTPSGRPKTRLWAATTGIVVALAAAGHLAAWAGFKRSTWGQILLISDERERGKAGPYVAELYDPLSNRFAVRRPVMKTGRIGATATVIPIGPNAGKILVAGGFNRRSSALSSSELYDPATNTFAAGPELPGDIANHAAIPIPSGPKAGWILLVGPAPSSLYDPTSNSFSPGPGAAYEYVYPTATVIRFGPNQGKILVAGEVSLLTMHVPGGNEYPRNGTEIYDPLSNTFQLGPQMNSGRYWYTATVIGAGVNAGKILLVGGLLQDHERVRTPLASTELYDPATNTFAPPRATATMKTARFSHTASVITSGSNAGKILIAGGQHADGDLLSATELYDPAANRFEPGPPMHLARTEHLAITIASGPNAGRILIAGGVVVQCDERGCETALASSTELYDPATNRFIPGPRMRGAPGYLIAVQLPPAPPR